MGIFGEAGVAAVEMAELRGVGLFEIPGWFKNFFLDPHENVAAAAGKRW